MYFNKFNTLMTGFCLLLFTSCFRGLYGDLLDDKLKIEAQKYSGNELKLGGYYYHELIGNDKLYRTVNFFYRDGCLFTPGAYLVGNQLQFEQDLQNYKSMPCYSDSKFSWGRFEVKDYKIRFEKWYPSSGGPIQAYVSEGVILNDTTFKITLSYRLKRNGKKTEIHTENEVYKFRFYSAKPDSTNIYTNP